MKKTDKIPVAALCFAVPESDAVQFSETDGKRKLQMKIYSGGIIKGHWWWGNLAIDLEGGMFPKKKYPVLENHDPNRKIGFSGKPIVDDGLSLNPETVEFVETEESQKFRELSQQGFPFEASLYGIPQSVERLEQGTSAEVNGMTVKGPASIWRKWLFKEASVCVFGWDSNTKSTAFENSEVEVTLDEVILPGDDRSGGTDKFQGKEGEDQMDLAELKEKYPDLMDTFKCEVTDELTSQFTEEKTALEGEISDLKGQLSKKDETINESNDRILKLEKAEAIRAESDLKAEADKIWSDKLVESNVSDRLYDKIQSQVSYDKFVKDGVLDREAFSDAIDKEIEDWVGRGATTSVMGGGGKLTRKVDGDTTEDQGAEKDEETVGTLLSLVGDKAAESK